MSELRPELPPLPPRLRSLPIRRGYPVPWFVTWLDNDTPVQRGEGEPDFRVITTETLAAAVQGKRCWVCGSRLGRHMAFVAGPMCAINRTSSEPPSHRDCADWSARACPFLTRPHAKRNTAGKLPGAGLGEDATAGRMLTRNPGVAMVWTTLGYRIVRDGRGGVLFRMGNPTSVVWYREGRLATREEVDESIESGYPSLRELAEQQGAAAVLELARRRHGIEGLLPA